MMQRQTRTSAAVFYVLVCWHYFLLFWKLSRLFSVVGVALDPGFQIFTYSTITEIVNCGTSSNQVGQITDEWEASGKENKIDHQGSFLRTCGQRSIKMGWDNNITCETAKRKQKMASLQYFWELLRTEARIPTAAVGEMLTGMRYTTTQERSSKEGLENNG